MMVIVMMKMMMMMMMITREHSTIQMEFRILPAQSQFERVVGEHNVEIMWLRWSI